MERKKIEGFLLELLEQKHVVPKDVDIDSFDYMKDGYVDSMSMIKFMVDIEDEFGITFEKDDIQNTDINILGQLINLIEKKIGEK